jgi:hypothetical protein
VWRAQSPQELFGAPTHEYAALADMGKVYELLLGFDEEAGCALRIAGYQKARELLTLHGQKVRSLALALMDRRELDQRAVADILA